MALQPVDGGSGNVNGDFRVESQIPSILVEPTGKVVDAVTVYATELAFGVPFVFTVSTATWQGAEFETYARVIASYIQEIGQAPHVVAIQSTPDTDKSGNLRDYLFVTVGIDGTDSEAVVKVLQDNANSQATFAALSSTYDLLVRNQNIGTTA